MQAIAHFHSRRGALKSAFLGAASGILLIGCATQRPQSTAPVSPVEPAKASPSANAAPNTATNSAAVAALFPVNEWKPLLDGSSLQGWKITGFGGHGDVMAEKNFQGSPAIIIEQGAALSGITWTNPIPNLDYEVTLEASKLLGSDFFCGLTFPFADSFCSFIVGGWGGAVVGISSIDGGDASMNETTKYIKFDDNRWYRFRVRVTNAKIESWIDNDKVVDLDTTGKKIHMRFGEIEESEPFGLATYQTRAAIRNVRLRRLPSTATK